MRQRFAIITGWTIIILAFCVFISNAFPPTPPTSIGTIATQNADAINATGGNVTGLTNLGAAGSCTETVEAWTGGFVTVRLACTGDSANGSIPTITISTDTMNLVKGTHYLYQVKAYPTSGGTAPDAADVTVNMNGADLLGGKGVNLIHATATYDTLPYSAFMSTYRYPAINGTVTVAVANQATNSANYTIELIFAR